MSTVNGCYRLESLEVIGYAKFDSEIVFNDISMSGESMAVSVSGDISFVSSAGSATVMTSGDITIDSTGGTVIIQSGVTSSVSGSVSLGYGDGTTGTHSIVKAEYDMAGNELLGFFGSTPVVKPEANPDVNAIHTALLELGLIHYPA
jgi:hypothetical protein